MSPAERLHRLRQRLYVRRCTGCADPSPHDAHLTALGRWHYAKLLPWQRSQP